ncbi:MAG: SdrD B-like domain-containing protein [Planctomycetota bacterium]
MKSARLLALILLTLSLLSPVGFAQDCATDPGFEITITPPVVPIGTMFEECLITPPGGYTVYMIASAQTGLTPTNYGPLCVAPPFFGVFVFPMPLSGVLCLGERLMPCDPAYIGFNANFQFVALSTSQPGSFGVSNLATMSIVDGPCNHPCTGSMGDFVWVDSNHNNVQDPGEPGIPGVMLLLKNSNGDVLEMTNTDANGYYAFNGQCAGTYQIEVVASTVPSGYLPVLCDVGGDDALDSDCSPHTVVLSADDSVDLDSDFGYAPPPSAPGLSLFKSAFPLTVAPYEPVTYFYTVTNTGNVTLTDVVVTDDNGTPDHAADDFVVGTVATLAPGASVLLTAEIYPVVCTGAVVEGNSVEAGAVIVVVPQLNGDIRVTYLQDFGINDNTYGSGQIGWPGNNHTFNHLVGSDKLEFQFRDGNDNVVLDFYLDYLSASTSFPSGYGSRGPTGGDGFMVSGSLSHIVSWTTSLAENLNHPLNVPKKSTLIVNSPTSLVSGNVVVDPVKAPGGWNHINSYTVVVKAAAFGSAGFGSVSVPDQHNSPNKLGGPNGMETYPVDCAVVNTAKALTVTAQGPLSATATATVQIDVPEPAEPCDLRVERVRFESKEIHIEIENSSDEDVFLNALTLTWPASNGKLKQIKLDGDIIYDVPDLSPPSANLGPSDFVTDMNKRKISARSSDTLKLIFEKTIDNDPSHYSGGTVTFGTDCTLNIP